MKGIKLRTSILASFSLLVALLSVSMSVFGFYVVTTYIMGEAQKQVNQNLKTSPSVYEKQLEKMAASGNAEMRVRSSGVIVYFFPEFAPDANDDFAV